MQTATAIADPVRRDILAMLKERPLAAGEIADGFEISRPAISRHLRMLRESGLVSDEARGRERIYTLRPQPLAELDSWLEDFRELWSDRLDALETEIYNKEKR